MRTQDDAFAAALAGDPLDDFDLAVAEAARADVDAIRDALALVALDVESPPRRTLRHVAVGLAAAAAVVGIVAVPVTRHRVPAPVASPSASRKGSVVVSRAKTYDFRALKRDATAVVVATATAEKTDEPIATIPFTVTTMTVVETLRGDVPASFPLRQLGSATVTLEGSSPVVGGQTYLLFLMPFEFRHGEPNGQLVAVGGPAGVFLQTGPDTFARTDLESPLPDHVSREDAVR